MDGLNFSTMLTKGIKSPGPTLVACKKILVLRTVTFWACVVRELSVVLVYKIRENYLRKFETYPLQSWSVLWSICDRVPCGEYFVFLYN